jgi:hypothetical protein
LLKVKDPDGAGYPEQFHNEGSHDLKKGREVRGLSWPELVEIPATTNPLSIKGIGESGTIGAPRTVVNAVLDALRDRGVEHLDMSLTPARIWQAANFSVKATA